MAEADLYFTLIPETFLDSNSRECLGFSLQYSAGSISPETFSLKTDVFTGTVQFSKLYYNFSIFCVVSNIIFVPSQPIPPGVDQDLVVRTFIAREDTKQGFFAIMHPLDDKNYANQVDERIFNKNSPTYLSLFVTEGTKDKDIPLGYTRLR